MNHRTAKRLIARMFFAELDGARVAEVLTHVAGCEACREYYARHRVMEDALYAAEAPVPDRAIQRLESAVFARLPPKQRVQRPGPLWVFALAALLLVPLSALLLDRATERDELRARGGQASGGDVGFRVLRVAEEAVTEVSELHPGDTLTFTYSNRSARWRQVRIDAHPERGPSFIVGGTARETISGAVDEPLPLTLRVDASFGDRLELVAVFSESPLDPSLTPPRDGDSVAIASETFAIKGTP